MADVKPDVGSDNFVHQVAIEVRPQLTHPQG